MTMFILKDNLTNSIIGIFQSENEAVTEAEKQAEKFSCLYPSYSILFTTVGQNNDVRLAGTLTVKDDSEDESEDESERILEYQDSEGRIIFWESLNHEQELNDLFNDSEEEEEYLDEEVF